MNRVLAWTLTLIVGLSGCLAATTPSPAPEDQAPGTWRTLAPMPSARQEVAVAEAGGKVYVIGGFGEWYAPSDTVDVYDPATDRWAAKAAMPTARHGIGAVAIDRLIYVPGGGTRPGPCRSSVLEAFEP